MWGMYNDSAGRGLFPAQAHWDDRAFRRGTEEREHAVHH